MTFKAINDLARPNGLVPILLVFRAYLRIIKLDALSPTVAQRATAIKKAIAEIHKLQAKQQIADTLSTHNGPKTDIVYSLPLSLPVLVQREGNTKQVGQQDSLFSLLNTKGKTYIIKLPHRPTTFCSTVVKLYLTELEKY